MKNQEYVKNAYDLLYDRKLVEVLRKKMNIVHKEGDFKAFIEELSPKKEAKADETEEKPKKVTKRKTAAKTEESDTQAAPVEEKPKKTREKSTKKTEKE